MHPLITIPVIFLSAILSGAFSMGGGVLALTTLATALDPSALIPVHGMIQLSSNLSRTLLAWRYIQRKAVLFFALGSLMGATAGRFFLPDLPPRPAAVLFSAGILIFTWKPKNRGTKGAPIKGNYIVAGGLAGYIALFMGVSGPIIAPFYLRDNYSKEELVATKSASQVFTHACKLGVFLSLGKIDGIMVRTALIYIPFVLIGNWIGQKLLGKLPEKAFLLFIKILISVLTARMVVTAF